MAPTPTGSRRQAMGRWRSTLDKESAQGLFPAKADNFPWVGRDVPSRLFLGDTHLPTARSSAGRPASGVYLRLNVFVLEPPSFSTSRSLR